MYLTDCRERSLKDVITQLEPGLFKKVTGLDVKDFELLCSLGVFNAGLMNDAIFKFKRYEDSSLSYTGINKHENEDIGGWDTVIKCKEYEQLFYNQQATMSADNLDEVTDDDDAIDITVETNQLSDFQTKDKAQIKESDLVTSSYGISQSINSKTSKPMTIQKARILIFLILKSVILSNINCLERERSAKSIKRKNISMSDLIKVKKCLFLTMCLRTDC